MLAERSGPHAPSGWPTANKEQAAPLKKPVSEKSFDYALTDEHKKKFAYVALKYPNDEEKQLQGVVEICESTGVPKSCSTGIATAKLNEWKSDPVVISEKEYLLEEYGEEHFLPTRAEYAREVWDIAHKTKDPDSRCKLLKLYGDITGMIEKPGTTINANTQINQNKVMVVRETFKDEDDWEEKLMESQRKIKGLGDGSESSEETK